MNQEGPTNTSKFGIQLCYACHIEERNERLVCNSLVKNFSGSEELAMLTKPLRMEGKIVWPATKRFNNVGSTILWQWTNRSTVFDAGQLRRAEYAILMPVGKVSGLYEECRQESLSKIHIVNWLDIHEVEDLRPSWDDENGGQFSFDLHSTKYI